VPAAEVSAAAAGFTVSFFTIAAAGRAGFSLVRDGAAMAALSAGGGSTRIRGARESLWAHKPVNSKNCAINNAPIILINALPFVWFAKLF
jgi:hypothetical protein